MSRVAVVGRALAGAAILCALASSASASAVVTIVNLDGAGEGFNDPAPRDPVGGNTGTTLGAQRLNAFRFAADRWAAALTSAVEIRVAARFDPLDCDAFGVTLGQSGPVSIFTDFAGAPRADTWYPSALADKLAGMDLAPEEDDIDASFNSAFGTTCDFPAGFYYGLDANVLDGETDFVTVVLHELGHGFGFLTYVDIDTGQRLDGRDDAFMEFLVDARSNRTFVEMTNAERASASRATGSLRWEGAAVVAASGGLQDGVDASGRVELYAPDPTEPGSSVSHWSDQVRPYQLLAPFFEAPIHDLGLAAPALRDIGWGIGTVACQADCNGDGAVAVNELMLAVRIALGESALAVCPAADAGGDGTVNISDVIDGVTQALEGCVP